MVTQISPKKNLEIKMTYSSGYGGSGKSTDIHSKAANVTAAMWGPYSYRKKKIDLKKLLLKVKYRKFLYNNWLPVITEILYSPEIS